MKALPSSSRIFQLLALSLIANLCLSSCGLFRRGDSDDRGGDQREKVQSLGDYRLKPGSILALEMFEGGKSRMVSDATVDNAGNLFVPSVGEVSVEGMPPISAAKKIEFLARKSGQNHLGGPRVHIKALNRRAVVHVSGRVNQPGPVTFSPGTTVAEAIEAAGGASAGANTSSVGLTTQGRKKIVTTSTTKELKEGDVVNVPKRL